MYLFSSSCLSNYNRNYWIWKLDQLFYEAPCKYYWKWSHVSMINVWSNDETACISHPLDKLYSSYYTLNSDILSVVCFPELRYFAYINTVKGDISVRINLLNTIWLIWKCILMYFICYLCYTKIIYRQGYKFMFFLSLQSAPNMWIILLYVYKSIYIVYCQ